MINADWVSGELRRTLGLLAAPADDQLLYLKSLSGSNDELGLEFDTVARASKELELMGRLTKDQVRAILVVDELLNEMSGPAHAELWEDQQIRTDGRWARVRELAEEALKALEGRAT